MKAELKKKLSTIEALNKKIEEFTTVEELLSVTKKRLKEYQTITTEHKEFCFNWNASIKKKLVQTDLIGDVIPGIMVGNVGGRNNRVNGIKSDGMKSGLMSKNSLMSGNLNLQSKNTFNSSVTIVTKNNINNN